MKATCALFKAISIKLYFFFVLQIFLSTVSSAIAAEELFSKMIENNNIVIEQCVTEVNRVAEDEFDTATRLYQTGVCYFCADCDFETDKGELFTSFEANQLILQENYETAYKLISQAAGLGYPQAYYGLAVLLYVEGLSNKRQTHVAIIENKTRQLSSTAKQERLKKKETQNSIEEIVNQIAEKQSSRGFSSEIHKHMLVAAKQGYVPAQFALSEIYFNGIGVVPDEVQAYAWAATAVAQNPPFGSLRRDEKAANLDEVELSEADAIAEEYMKKHTAIFDSSSVTVMR